VFILFCLAHYVYFCLALSKNPRETPGSLNNLGVAWMRSGAIDNAYPILKRAHEMAAGKDEGIARNFGVCCSALQQRHAQAQLLAKQKAEEEEEEEEVRRIRDKPPTATLSVGGTTIDDTTAQVTVNATVQCVISGHIDGEWREQWREHWREGKHDGSGQVCLGK
jgi:hypothetical protein